MKTDYKKTTELIDGISKSFCAAKWYNTSIWLGNGKTASCHHPPSHPIPLKELETNPSALHNTQFKKEQRKAMLEGKRPSECSYCWKVEDTVKKETGIFSDRVYQTARYTEKEINALKKLPWDANIPPKTIEICFDNLCNLACTYCNAEFSSTWSKDIKDNGAYVGLATPGGKTYSQDGSIAMPFGNKNEGNIYVKKFFEWFEDIRGTIDELRVSGGEPSRSPSFWKLLEICNNDTFEFAVNSNLIMDDARLEKLTAVGGKFKSFEIYTSAECVGKNQEFVRDGFEWDVWEKNVFKVINATHVDRLHIMMTISLLSIWTVDEFLQTVINWRKQINNPDNLYLSVNILRFPSFQSVNMLPQDIKDNLAYKIEKVVVKNKEWLKDWEINHFQRLLNYLRNVEKSYEDQDSLDNKVNDLVKFITQFETRRKKPVEEYMPQDFTKWYNNLNNQE